MHGVTSLLLSIRYDISMLARTGLSRGNRLGAAAWLGLLAYVTAYDVFALRKKYPTLSAAFYTFSASRFRGIGLFLFWFYLTAHLFRWIPQKYDLFRRYVG